MRPELSRMLWVCGAFLSVALQLFGAFQMSRMIWFTWPSTGNPSEKWQFLSSPPVLKICAGECPDSVGHSSRESIRQTLHR
ncbi:hypothetical protein C8J57DRAFT_1421085 [Mycena rebaudengoi]|nr:hypothetical protein C8J57DRAFT_1421085 [Mycena rebaudengoi]